MTAPRPGRARNGGLRRGPETTLVERTVDFIRSQLPNWRDDPDRSSEEAEDRLNLQLCDYLDCSARADFPMVHFSREEPQAGQRKVDLAAKPMGPATIHGRQYTIYDPFLVIEGKRLPAPTSNREREYVTGGAETTGGMQRFKLGVHGAEHRKAVLVGYVQREDGEYWWRTINGWIDSLSATSGSNDCQWDASDQLQDLQIAPNEGVAVCRSTHQRQGDAMCERIELEHLWVLMWFTS